MPEQLWLAGAGLHLLVLNPCTAEVTLDKVFPTGEPGAHRELTWTLANIQDNRVVVVASVVSDGDSAAFGVNGDIKTPWFGC